MTIAHHALIGAVSSGAAEGYLDTFDETGDTLLKNHIANTGQPYSLIFGESTVKAGLGYLVPTTLVASTAASVADIGISDYSLQSNIRHGNTGNDSCGGYFRFVDVNNRLQWDSFGQALRVFRVVGGGFTALANVGGLFNLNTDHKVVVECNGSLVKIFVDDIIRFNQTVNFHITAKKVGPTFVSLAVGAQRYYDMQTL